MSAIDQHPFPRGALLAAAAMIGVSLSGTAAVRLARVLSPPPAVPAAAAPAVSVDLRFQDEPNGAIRVSESRTDRQIAVIQPGDGGFVRGVLRGLARDRISRRIGEAPPFRLAQALDGHLSLEDTSTGRLIDLESFGRDNRASFIRLLPARLPS